MERYIIFIPATGKCSLIQCDDECPATLETLQELVDGPIEVTPSCLGASWAREPVDGMVAVEEWAEIHGKTPATVRRKIHANAWPDAKQSTLDGKLVWMLDEDWLWPRAMTPTKQAKLLCEIRRLMPPVVYTTAEDGTVICMVPCTHHTHVASGVTADEMNDLWRAAPPQRAAAQAALQYGWLHPLADPRSYNERGERLHNAYNRKK